MYQSKWQLSRLFGCITLSAMLLGFTGGCEKDSDVGGPGGIAPGGVAPDEVMPGGIPPGTTKNSANNSPNKSANNSENTFVLTVPSGQVDISRGESQNVSVGIDRGSVFNQSVEVSLSATAQGLTIEPAQTTLTAGQSEVEFMLKAAADAAVGVTNVSVLGKPQTGESVNTTIKVQINEN